MADVESFLACLECPFAGVFKLYYVLTGCMLTRYIVFSGLEVMRQLRSFGRQDFVVGVTGNALKEDQEEYYEAGVDQYVPIEHFFNVLAKPNLFAVY